MKRFLVFLTFLLCAAVLMTACTKENPPETHIVHDGRLWKLPSETVATELPEGAELTDAIVIAENMLPSEEGECNVGHGKVQIYDGDGFFLVIVDGVQHRIER